MSNLHPITPESLSSNPFSMIGKQWMLITAKNQSGKINTMTASWGGLGVLWGKNVAYVVIRPQRYTKEFIDDSNTFSLTFFDEVYRKQLSYLGAVSGRDEDKITKSGLTLASFQNIPYFSEAETILFCNKLYAQQLNPECFFTPQLDQQWYPNKDYHTLYVAEIISLQTTKI